MGAGTQLIDAAKAIGVDALELWGQCTRTALLRSARVLRHPSYGRRGQRGANAGYPLSVGMSGPLRGRGETGNGSRKVK